jgi:hypothetical protein
VRTVSSEQGQVAVVAVLFLMTVLGMTALVLDVGSWFRADRRVQATADAAALAGAQLLPEDPAGAFDEAIEYAGKNGGGVAPSDVSVSTRVLPNDTITVSARDEAPGFFSKLFGVFSVHVRGDAVARAANVSRARWVAPIAVNEQHPLLQCQPDPCFGQTTQIELANLQDPASANGSGSFGLLRLNHDPGSIATSVIASWLRDGYPQPLGTGLFPAATGAKFNSGDFKDALNERLGDELLFPVFRSLVGTGANAQFEVIGWVAFVPEAFTGSGSSGSLTGRFVRVTWDGSETDDPNAPDFGVRTVLLVA